MSFGMAAAFGLDGALGWIGGKKIRVSSSLGAERGIGFLDSLVVLKKRGPGPRLVSLTFGSNHCFSGYFAWFNLGRRL